MEEEDDTERNLLKRSAFNQYFTITQEMASFEKELFAKFLHEGTFNVNNGLKRNILKLKFMTLPEELKEEIVKRDAPQAMAVSRFQKSGRVKPKPRQSQSILATLVPRKSMPTKSKFNIFSTAIQWIAARPGTSDNPDLALAEKLLKASDSAFSVKSTRSAQVRNDFKISQAKCKIS